MAGRETRLARLFNRDGNAVIVAAESVRLGRTGQELPLGPC